MKKAFSLFLAAILLLACLSACGGSKQPAAERGKLQIVTTIFPIYDWVLNVLGDNPAEAEVTMLLSSGVDLHSFQPSAADILKISTCDLFVYVGGESDAWVDDALKEAVNKDMTVVNLMDALGDAVMEEEVIEGMEAEEAEDEGEEEESEYDEHIWLSLRNAADLTHSIAAALETVDAAHAETYKANAAAYIAKLNVLDDAYRAAVDGAAVKTLLFGDRFPFRYLTEDYDLDYYAAFAGCSAETEASFATVTFLAGKVDELSLPAVCTIEGTDHRIAETVVANTQAKNQKILNLDSMQSVTAKDAAAGVTYLSVMERNLTVLKEALGG